MSIGAALSIATGAIGGINQQLALVSHNIANANTPGYATESVVPVALSAGGMGMGVANGPVRAAMDRQAQAELLAQNGDVAAAQTQQAALQEIDAVLGAVGGGGDIGGLLGALSNQFSALAVDPSGQTQQRAVVGAAQALAAQINAVSAAIGTARQGAQDSIVSATDSLNRTLTALGALSDRIVQARAQGLGTADLDNQRAAAQDALSRLVSVRFLDQPDGDLIAVTSSGLNLPLHGPDPAFATSAANLGPSSYAPGNGVPAITLGGRDVTAQLGGGQIGGAIALRDSTLPVMQANLDEFAQTLTTRFDAQGLTLFTDAAGKVPASTTPPVQSGYLGYASTIQVNPAVAASPSLVRDGTHAVAAGAGGATAFTPNPPGGPAGFTDMLTRVLHYALGANVAPNVPQPAPNTTGLGPSGTLASGYAAPADLSGLAAAVTAASARTSADVTARLTGAQTVQATLQATFSAATGVSVDGEMSKMIVLQNAYGANARVMSAVQSMWSQLLQAVQ